MKNKAEQLRRKLIQMQQPTADAIKEQVSREVDEQLPKKVVESALKNSYNKKQKRKGLAHAISELKKEFMLKRSRSSIFFGKSICGFRYE